MILGDSRLGEALVFGPIDFAPAPMAPGNTPASAAEPPPVGNDDPPTN